MVCRYCGAPITYRKRSKGWLHASPLGQLRISRAEHLDVIADPPHAGEPLHRQTVLHPAQPG